MIYCIFNSVSYSSSFNIFAVAAGIFLLRGNLRTASVVRWFAVFMFSAFSGVLLVWSFVQPLDLTLTEARLSPLASVTWMALTAFVLALLLWLYRELGRAPILEANAAAGRKVRDMRIPAAIGLGFVIATTIFVTVLLGGETAAKAKALAQQQLGTGYSYHVSSLQIRSSSAGTNVAANVTAWNEKEVRDVSIAWREQ
jgi:hypothetical protein